nr:RNA-directed DNA polymerase, eukaryota [Tanacetum cinerariifolium]
MELLNKYHELKQLDSKDAVQKAKVKWAIEGDENSKFFHGIINKRRSQLAIRGVFVNGDWHTEPSLVKDTFLDHFSNRFKQPSSARFKLSLPFPSRLSSDQVLDLDKNISSDEICAAVWDCGENKSPGPDGYTFKFFRRYWNVIGPDFCLAVDYFFENGTFPRGCNASFIALIPKVVDAKLVTDFRPISLIGSVKRKQALVFKVELTILFGGICSLILFMLLVLGRDGACRFKVFFSSNMASILVNGSPTAEFPICCGLKQGDPLAPLFFILVMETLHISVSRAVNEGIFRGLHIQGSVILSHLFYTDDAVFIGEWSDSNLDNMLWILNCFYLASGLRINVSKSQVLGIGVPSDIVQQGASRIGCDIMKTPFKYLGVIVGDNMSRLSAWSNSIQKIHAKLSKWKVKTLSIGGRLTLLKSVLGATPVYNMSIFKAPSLVLHEMEMLRNNFFIGGDVQGKKITWIAWDKVLSSKINGGLDVSSFYALNRALLFKWVWRFLSHDGSLWSQIIRAIHENNINASVAVKKGASSLDASFRRPVRDGVERSQWEDLVSLVGGISLSVSADRWVCDLTSDATRWVKHVPIKVNIFAWRARLDRLSTHGNLILRGVLLDSSYCLNWDLATEDSHHLFSVKLKAILEGVFFTSWWHLWLFRNRLLFDTSPPRRSVLFEDIVSSSFLWSVNR